MLEFLSAGTLLGLAAGFAPGPLLVLVVSETLRHGIKAGLKVSIAPLITDVPIIFISLIVLNRLAQFKSILGCISIFGGFLCSFCFAHLPCGSPTGLFGGVGGGVPEQFLHLPQMVQLGHSSLVPHGPLLDGSRDLRQEKRGVIHFYSLEWPWPIRESLWRI